jgi:hypothetical protein
VAYTAEASTMLTETMTASSRDNRPLRFAAGPIVRSKHSAEYWAGVTAGFDFSIADQVPPAQFKRVVWAGLMTTPYPDARLPFSVR